MQHHEVVILGAGAAGLMCAITAGRRGRQVLVLERSNKVGKKILMSGGGRCNFTNLLVEPERFLSHNPHFCKSALSRYTQWDFIGLVEKHAIAYHEKSQAGGEPGQLFCDESSRQILGMLLQECEEVGVEIRTRCEVETVDESEAGYVLQLADGEPILAQSLVVATGGLSIPSLGGSGFGYELARKFGLHVFPVQAGLAPFVFSGGFKALSSRLSGLSLPARISCGSQAFTGNILFTHRGLSGPAVLQISSYWQLGEPVELDLLPGDDTLRLLRSARKDRPKVLLRTLLGGLLPTRLVQELEKLWWPTAAETPIAELPDSLLGKVAGQLHGWQLKPAATEGYRTAEVTLGGVDTGMLSSRTMESKANPGLYFIGEVVDVTGQLGGFNFQWAWSSGVAAGEVV